MQFYEIIVLKMSLKLATRPQIGLGGRNFFFVVWGGIKFSVLLGGVWFLCFFKNSMFNFFLVLNKC